jgi:glycosyltransferase involved in cell wall biosynthesis
MSLYAKESPDFFRYAVDSLAVQTLPPAEVVMVLDGPITPALLTIVNYAEIKLPLKVYAIDRNVGLAHALNAGVAQCSYEWIARFDTDDVCSPDRFEVQFQFLAEHPDVGLVGSWVHEFNIDPTEPKSTRIVPSEHDEILRYARNRNPFNHPSVVFRRSLVLSAGGYPDFKLFEDYGLWVRLIQKGVRVANIPRCLVRMRQGAGMYDRRGGVSYLRGELQGLREFYRTGFISFWQLVRSAAPRILLRLLPATIRRLLYLLLLRHSAR